MKITAKEAFSIPNILSYIRILLIPLFTILYFRADVTAEYLAAGVIILVSGLTDLADGFIARRYGMITELGKALDPIADKLTQFMIIVCLVSRYRGMILLAALFVCKELYKGINDLLLLRRGKKLGGAMWFGKVSTAVFYLTTVILIAVPELPLPAANGIMLVTGFFLLLSFVLYAPVFYRMYRESAQEQKKEHSEKE